VGAASSQGHWRHFRGLGRQHPSDLGPGDIVLPTRSSTTPGAANRTFFDGNGTPVTHIDFTEPYDRELRQRIREAGEGLGIEVKVGGVYAATQGPRLETAAEINRLERDGADLVGMTGMPEAVLARELGLPYARSTSSPTTRRSWQQRQWHPFREPRMCCTRPWGACGRSSSAGRLPG
jgi:purine nucleoside phosphorylase